MGILSSIFSSSDTVSKITDTVVSAGDKLVLTDEEKADLNLKYMELMPNIIQQYQPFRLAQRVIAFGFSILFVFTFLIGLGMLLFNAIVKYKSATLGIKNPILLDIEPLLNLMNAFSLGWIMTTIVCFYYAGGVVDSIKRKL